MGQVNKIKLFLHLKTHKEGMGKECGFGSCRLEIGKKFKKESAFRVLFNSY